MISMGLKQPPTKGSHFRKMNQDLPDSISMGKYVFKLNFPKQQYEAVNGMGRVILIISVEYYLKNTEAFMQVNGKPAPQNNS